MTRQREIGPRLGPGVARAISAILAVVCLAPPAWAVKIPTSPEDVRRLSDEELFEVIDYFNGQFTPVVHRFWKNMGESFGVRNGVEFEAMFPRFTRFLDEYYRQATAGNASGSFLASPVGAEDACEEGGFANIVRDSALRAAWLTVAVIEIEHQGFVGEYADVAKRHLQDDLRAVCPTCSEEAIDAGEYLFIEEAADARLAAVNRDHMGSLDAPVRLFLYLECMMERCKRGLARGTLCRELPWHPQCAPGRGRERRCGDWFDPNMDPASPGPSNITGNQQLLPDPPDSGGIDCIFLSCFDDIDVPGSNPQLPEIPPGGGTIPPPGSFDPNADDPSRECWGPCCGPKGGGGRNGGGATCWLDGVLVPCHPYF